MASLFKKFNFLTISSEGNYKINKIPDLKEFINMINITRKGRIERKNKTLTKIDDEYCIKYLKDRGYKILKPKIVEYEEC